MNDNPEPPHQTPSQTPNQPQHHKIDYVEFASADPQASCDFFASVFGWRFTWYGPDYVAFHGAGLEGGIYRDELRSRAGEGGALIVFYSHDLDASLALVRQHQQTRFWLSRWAPLPFPRASRQ